MTGKVFNIQRFCINDGPGIRTTVFLKGCPLNCIWCHNPESKRSTNEIFFDKSKCVSCGRCVTVCQNNCHSFADGKVAFDRDNCVDCGKCVTTCPADALLRVGEDKTAEEVIAEVLKDEVFYKNSSGGITVSGGEPTLQPKFTYEILKSAKEHGINTAIETCGYAKTEVLKKLSCVTDLFLFDYKVTDPKEHIKYTGVDNKLILDNLEMLNSVNANVILRCPIIPGVNDNDAHFTAIGELADRYQCIREVQIEPYHPLGKSKSERLDLEYKLSDLDFCSDEETAKYLDSIKRHTGKKVSKA